MCRPSARRSYRVSISQTAMQSPTEYRDTVQLLAQELGRLIESESALINEALREELGPPGVPANAGGLVYVARRLANVYRLFLDVGIRMRHHHGGGAFQGVERAFMDLVLEQAGFLEDLARSSAAGAVDALEHRSASGSLALVVMPAA